MAKFTYNGKTYNTKDRKGGMSEREYIASIKGGSVEKNDKKKNKGNSGNSSNGVSPLSDMVRQTAQEVLGATPGFRDPMQDFEQSYTPELQAEDATQARALFDPYYNEQINNLLDDLKTTEEMDSVSYDRTLRRNRASLALGGGAIGSEREQADKAITDDKNNTQNQRRKVIERTVGTERMQGAGFGSVTGNPIEGSLIGEMKANIADQTLWNKNQRLNRYMSQAQNYYNQSANTSLSGKKL